MPNEPFQSSAEHRVLRSAANDGSQPDGGDDTRARWRQQQRANIHPKSDQVVLLVDGELTAEVGEEKRRLRSGDIVIVPAGTPHKFTNSGMATAKAFSTYAPPAYPAKKK